MEHCDLGRRGPLALPRGQTGALSTPDRLFWGLIHPHTTLFVVQPCTVVGIWSVRESRSPWLATPHEALLLRSATSSCIALHTDHEASAQSCLSLLPLVLCCEHDALTRSSEALRLKTYGVACCWHPSCQVLGALCMLCWSLEHLAAPGCLHCIYPPVRCLSEKLILPACVLRCSDCDGRCHPTGLSPHRH